MSRRRRLAVVDLLFAHPPRGGAGRDLYETLTRLQADYELCLFHPLFPPPFPRYSPEQPPPFPTQAVLCTELTREAICTTLKQAVDAFRPDLVLVADGWTLKPYVISALAASYPTVVRLYAYEMLCPRNNECWPYDHACGQTILTAPDGCLACCRQYAEVVCQHRGSAGNPLIQEAHIARIDQGDYRRDVLTALQQAAALLVYNSRAANDLKQHAGVHAEVVPGGVDPQRFRPPPRTGKRETLHVVVVGRMDDPAKGATTAIAAGDILAHRQVPFRMTITRTPQLPRPWLTETGWLDADAVTQLLHQADVAVVPSLWQEAFGMTWLEAMAAELPVVASAVAGPLDHIRDGVNGLLFSPSDATALADILQRLQLEPDRRRRLGSAGRQTAEILTWDHAAALTGRVLQQVSAGQYPRISSS